MMSLSNVSIFEVDIAYHCTMLLIIFYVILYLTHSILIEMMTFSQSHFET